MGNKLKSEIQAYLEKKNNEIYELIRYSENILSDIEHIKHATNNSDKEAEEKGLVSLNKHCQRISLSTEKLLSERIRRPTFSIQTENDSYDIDIGSVSKWELINGVLHIHLPYYPANTYADDLSAVHQYKINQYYKDIKAVAEECKFEISETNLLIYRYHFMKESRLRDLDNFYTKPITDQLARYFLPDDNYRHLSFLYDCICDDTEETEIIIVPNYKIF